LAEDALVEDLITLPREFVTPPVDRHLLTQDYADFIVQRQHFRRLRIVDTDHVNAGLFHSPDIGEQQVSRGARSETSILVVAVYTSGGELLAIDEDLSPVRLDFADTKPRREFIGVTAVPQGNVQVVKVWLVWRP